MEAVVVFVCLVPFIFIAGVAGFVIGRATARRADPRRQFADLVQFWRQSRQIDDASAEQVLRLLRIGDRASLLEPVDLVAAPAASGAPAMPAITEVAEAAAPAASGAPAMPAITEVAEAAAPAASGAPIAPAVTNAESASAQANPPASSAPDRLGPLFAALLSLGTRRTLLVIGSFLVVISSLVLVIFNWNSFAPFVQVSLLAALTGGLWWLGRWMEQRDDLAAAGRNLSAVAALLAPVVAFSFTRPGVLGLESPLALLIVSGFSVVLYVGGAWRTRRVFYSLAASAAAIAVLMSALWQWEVAARWQPAWSFGLWALALVVAHRLARSSAAALAIGPRIAQWAGLPLALLISLSLLLAHPTPSEAFATIVTLALGAGFGAGAAWLERQPRWIWLTASALPLAVVAGGVLPDAGIAWINQGLAALALAYIGGAALLERHSPAYAMPLLAVAPVLGLTVVSATLDRAAVLRHYPLLIGATGLALVLLERGRLSVAQSHRTPIGVGLLSATILLLTGWLAMMGETWGQRGFIALVAGSGALLLNALPVMTRIPYAPRTCRYMGASLMAMSALVVALTDVDLRLPALALATVLYGWEAERSRAQMWALACLTAGVMGIAAGLWRLGWLATFDHYLVTGMSLAGALGIGGSLARAGSQRYWTMPALGWAGLLGSISSLLLLTALYLPSWAAVGAALIGGASCIVIGALWQRWWAGYPAAALLGIAWMVCIAGGFVVWRGDLDALAVLAVPLSAGYGLIALAMRRWPTFDRPYAHAALAVALATPFPALAALDPANDVTVIANLPLAAGGSTALLAAGALIYRRWRLLSLSLTHLMITIGGLAHWLALRDNEVTGWVLLIAASVSSLGGLAARRWWAWPLPRRIGADSYGIAGATTLVALSLLFTGHVSSLRLPLLVGAIVVALIAAQEQREIGAWISGAALIGSIVGWLALLPVTNAWLAAWLALTMAPLIVVGWIGQRWSAGAVWQRPTLWLPLAVGVVAVTLAAFEVRALVVALINAGVVLVTASARERRSEYGYLAGAAFVAAGLGQFLVWEVTEIQVYVMPVGIYLLMLANGIRYFQRRDGLARLIDTSAVILLLGVTLVQAAGSSGNITTILLIGGEALLITGYGALARLRAPFIGGIAGFVLSVLWLAVNAAQVLNQWLLLGILGLLMLLAYVVLERQQAQLRRFGRNWALRLQQWR